MQEPVVYLVDDDAAVLDSLPMLIRAIGLAVKPYNHPDAFFREFSDEHVGCILLDLRMPIFSGMVVHEKLRAMGCRLPVIFITGHGDIAQCRKAFQNGAIDFLTKPIDDQALIDSLQKAISVSIGEHQRHVQRSAISEKFQRLSKREQEVCDLIVQGLPNKMIAKQLDLALRTTENHRAAVYRKLEITSLSELVKLSLALA